MKSLTFLGLYVFASFAIVPILAESLGRVPLPIISDDRVKPLNMMTCVLNRHYVKPELLKTVDKVANKINQTYPGTVISYLDASFPFIDKFPLFPHLSHSDGKKLDIALLYIDSKTKQPINNSAPSFIGYGVYEKPLVGEINMPSNCANKGYWQYSFLENFVTQWNRDAMTFDQARTKELITLLVQEDAIGKLFVEPHLKARMNLNYDKVRFHGCQAVRHDDHIHLQL